MGVRTFFSLLAVFFMLGTVAASTAAPELLGRYRDWDAFVISDGGNKTCYMRSVPLKTEPSNVKRGDIVLFVTHRTQGDVSNEISILTGYPYKEGSSVSAEVDGSTSFTLFTQGDGAWLERAADEAAMVKAMRAGQRLIVKGVSQRGTRTTDRYSLSGFTSAHKKIGTACGVQ